MDKVAEGENLQQDISSSSLADQLPNHEKSVDDIKRAIQVAKLVIQTTSRDDPNLGNLLNSLGNQIEDLYELTEEQKQLEEAIHVARQAIATPPEDEAVRSAFMINLGIKLERRWKATDDLSDLNEAVDVYKT